MTKRELLRALEKVPMDAIIMIAQEGLCLGDYRRAASGVNGYIIDVKMDEPTVICLKDW